jgi:hypothetical protein
MELSEQCKQLKQENKQLTNMVTVKSDADACHLEVLK